MPAVSELYVHVPLVDPTNGAVCRRCGISRPTLRKWWRRYQADGVAGLKDESRRPRRLAKQKVFADQEALVVQLRRSRHLGIKQLRSELLRQHGLGLSLDTLHRILVRHGEQHLKRPKLTRKGKKRYSRPVPGDRVQLDVCKRTRRLSVHGDRRLFTIQSSRRLSPPHRRQHLGFPGEST